MGVVYESEDSRLGRRVALKFLPEQMAQNTQLAERFQREARAASALNHPNICTIHAIEHLDGQNFLVMELLEGQTLAQMLGRVTFTMDKLLPIATQLADALESAHAKGIVHRDIKPANIFLTDRSQVKTLDFGLVKIEPDELQPVEQNSTKIEPQHQLTSPGVAMGTASYMSPEQARGQLVDARTDLFSLGSVLYQMAGGVMPFAGDTAAVIFDAILNRDPEPVDKINPALPAEFGRILSKLLEKDRALRCQSATELKTDLNRLKRNLDSGIKRAAELTETKTGLPKPGTKSVAVLYFENLSAAKEDEYLRDGITEDIITELSKIRGLNTFSRPTVLAFRDKSATPSQVGNLLRAAFVLTGTLRRAGSRLRITTQLVDTQTEFPLWSERYHREMKDVFEFQD
jgi:non-specific serine/threonine protein kinase